MEQTQQPKYFIVESTVLPEIYLKVAQAKRLLETQAFELRVRR